MDKAVYILITYPDGVSEEWFLTDRGEVEKIINQLGQPDNIIRPENYSTTITRL